MKTDEKYMRMALALARRARGLTSPNPAVGAVIVKLGKVVGSGYHRRAGLPHAEAVAISRAGSLARGATLYVTLEPCNHFGRTPPCTDAIIASGIRRVVIGMRDPNPITDGRGIKKLSAHRISTTIGVLKDEAEGLNLPFIKFMKRGLPYVTVKIAESLDGKIATRTGDSKWISSNESRSRVQKMRESSDAVMVGVNTVIGDRPILLARAPYGRARQPVRVIVDTRLRTPLDSPVLSTANVSPVIIATTEGATKKRFDAYRSKGATIIITKSRDGRVDLADLCRRLGRMGIINILVEGGGELVAGLLRAKLIDRFLFFIAPRIIGGILAPTSVEGLGAGNIKDAVDLKDIRVTRSSTDILIEARPG